MYLLKCSLLLVLTTFSRFLSSHMSGLHLIGNPSQLWHIREEVRLSYVIRCLDWGSRFPSIVSALLSLSSVVLNGWIFALWLQDGCCTSRQEEK